jgi:hypothetical protein
MQRPRFMREQITTIVSEHDAGASVTELANR